MKVAFVSPRWAVDVRGGAETAARETAERLAAGGWSVEVFTTRAVDHFTWADELPEGDELLNGVRVHRFSALGNRFPSEPELAGRVAHRPWAATLEESRHWVDLLGPSSDALVAAVGDSDADVVVFTPYLFAPTVRGVPAAGARAVMAPAAHDEPLLRLPVYQETFAAAGGFVFYTPEERALVEQRFRVAHAPASITGIGVTGAPGGAGGRADLLPERLRDRPYVVCLGRVERAKGSRMLARYFEVYKDRHPGPLQLVFAGPTDQEGSYREDDVVLTGPVDEAVKWAILEHAVAMVSPSPYESFSIVLMEGWLAGLPVIVNGGCAVTAGHAVRSRGGLWFDDYPTFEAALTRMVTDEGLRHRLAGRGKAYVEEHYAWPVVLERYRGFLELMADRVATTTPP